MVYYIDLLPESLSRISSLTIQADQPSNNPLYRPIRQLTTQAGPCLLHLSTRFLICYHGCCSTLDGSVVDSDYWIR